MAHLMRPLSVLIICLLLVPGSTPAANNDGPGKPGSKKVSAVGAQQQRVQKMMRDLEEKFVRLADMLKKTEPEKAARLQKAIDQTKESLIRYRMNEISRQLDNENFDKATKDQKQIVADLVRLIDLLQEKDELDQKLEEIERLEQWRKEVEKIIAEETAEKRESDKVANKDKTLVDIDKAIRNIKDLIKRQQGVIDKTSKSRNSGGHGLGRVADDQKDVRAKTEKVAAAIGRVGLPGSQDGGKPGGQQAGKPGGQAKPGGQQGGKPGGQQGGKPDGKPDGTKPDGKPDGKPGTKPDGKPDGKPGGQQAGKPGGQQGGKPGGQQAGKPGGQQGGKPGGQQAGKPGGQQAGKPGGQQGGKPGNEPGQRPLADAIKNQKDAEENLVKGKGKAAEGNEKQALKDLNKALKALENERQRIAKLPPEHFEKMAKDQDRTSDKTGDLAKRMAKAGGEKGGQQGQQGGKPGQQGGKPGQQGGKPGQQGGKPGQQGGKPGQQGQQPGQQQVQQAQKHMQGASGDLRKKQAKKAGGDQQDAIEELQKAKDKIEERLAQLRQELQEELLAALLTRFQDMLAQQQDISRQTKSLYEIREERQWKRVERLHVDELAARESHLADLAQRALDIIKEDGTTIVFPQVVGGLRDDLTATGDLLRALKTGQYTQDLQIEIERTLEDLIKALEKAMKQQQQQGKPQQGKPQQGKPKNPPLVPDSAELKLLKAAQMRVNRRTTSFDKNRPQGPIEPAFEKEVDNIAKRQGEVSKMTQDMIERK
jgi:hypothetical protein